jgi:uncharacterized membrane protein (GlpM family)
MLYISCQALLLQEQPALPSLFAALPHFQIAALWQESSNRIAISLYCKYIDSIFLLYKTKLWIFTHRARNKLSLLSAVRAWASIQATL